ncbi:membrane spanning protein [Streptomyces sviceus ATCC 29083]|uniref:Membrane spanning protein n=1 Tax=Streptomyces sviceus (strain ATCC 29083 / DSM 924 / JCM 4929 / NBRC 13980 / NCIMB 11184 / NRRL 5439 / UC 5370) TaxID=463191 RepID=B5HVH1_STRX2|nr:membrane spanning protein [Streptomyces sviceus ATCC 29083]
MSGGATEREVGGGGFSAARYGGEWCACARLDGARCACAPSDSGRFAKAWVGAGRFTRAGCRSVARCVGAQVVGARSDRGSATVWSVGAIAVLCVVFGAVLGLGQAVVVRHRAAGGADLAALAAADHWADGPAVACARAEEVARDQDARIVRCVMVGEISDVTAASGRGPFTAEVRARAGPAGPVPSQAPLPPTPGARAPEGVPLEASQGAPPPAPPATAP